MAKLMTEQVGIAYGDHHVVRDLDLDIPENQITTIIGPNGCGKSTILKALARIHSVQEGSIYLDGKAIKKESTKEIAKKMGVLPQTPKAPSGLTVSELVSYGRYPHQKGFGKLSDHDREVIQWALEITGVEEFSNRSIDALSGGQRQRVWIAMALAQETELLILDEPTTYLDLAHQLEVLKLLEQLNREEGRTIVMVIHDLNHAARFADYIVALRGGKVIREGTPEDVIRKDVLKEVFQIDAEVVQDPRTNRPICLTYDLLGSVPEVCQKAVL
ncbi:ABC transporter ATP-binding protein [Halobacillus sp. ACCC02827]|uniref:ABC transporter ATP-binding protein n=1 Tax=unclassified Halobacillus TaxID=2636472 RepID=UPI0007847279|nr:MULTISPECIES: ABC transporter ATP-binding protein [unclassified Halobacillus]WJE16056.1 ABC transporter ATP-binding protein [Halobacillus sp. ACCC02827]